MIAAAFIFGVTLALVGYHLITADVRHQADLCAAETDRADNAEAERDKARRQLDEANRIAAELLRRFGGDTPLALGAEVAVTAGIDQEWADLCAAADVERVWGGGELE